jgi:ubiquinone/menaquinone biosynthesis C-methylase UbiE/intracellular sulfur oxidation DsrE/DsrF family protein
LRSFGRTFNFEVTVSLEKFTMVDEFRKSTSMFSPKRFHWLVVILFITGVTSAQEKSVRPGINESFRAPDVSQFQQRFETESREVYKSREEIVAALGLKPGMTVADIGAGTGLFTRLFAEEVGPEGRVIAVDISKNFLEHIERTSREAGIKNIETQLCTDDSTGLVSESIDVAYICDTYHHFEFPVKTMTSIQKALKRDGHLFLIDFQRIPGERSDFVMGHVRAGKDVFVSEVIQAGFRKSRDIENLLKENYFVEFAKSPSPGLNPVEYPLITGYGGIVRVPKAAESLKKGAKVLFDVTADNGPESVNKGMERAARVLNLATASGLNTSDVHITIIVHGAATKTALNDSFYNDRFQANRNPNRDLIGELKKAGVELFVCGQALDYNGFPASRVSEDFLVADSALSVIINRQSEGAAYLPAH